MHMTAEGLMRARQRMFYFHILLALQEKRYTVQRVWLEDYFVPLTLLAIRKQGLKLDLERTHGVWPGLHNMLDEAENLEIVRPQGHESGMLTFETDKMRLLRVVNTDDSCLKRRERPILERAARNVVRLYLGGMSYKHTESLYLEAKEPKPSA